jgi:hypothetical protein
MRRNLLKALLWMLPVPLLCGWIEPPKAPASGNIGDRFPYLQYMQPLSIGGAVQEGAGLRPGYTAHTLQVPAGSQLKLEVTHLGSSMHLDTGLFVYGPKDANGSYGAAPVVQDDDSGYGELSRIDLANLPRGGEYLVVVGWGNAAGKQYRVQVNCVGGACLPPTSPAPTGHTLALVEQRLPPRLQSRLETANEVREDNFSYVRHFDFLWPYTTAPSMNAAVGAVLSQGLYEGYVADPNAAALTPAQLQAEMYWQFQPLFADLLAYGSPSEPVQVRRFSRSFETGPNGDNWRSLYIVFFPSSFRVVVYEQTGHEI